MDEQLLSAFLCSSTFQIKIKKAFKKKYVGNLTTLGVAVKTTTFQCLGSIPRSSSWLLAPGKSSNSSGAWVPVPRGGRGERILAPGFTLSPTLVPVAAGSEPALYLCLSNFKKFIKLLGMGSQ